MTRIVPVARSGIVALLASSSANRNAAGFAVVGAFVPHLNVASPRHQTYRFAPSHRNFNDRKFQSCFFSTSLAMSSSPTQRVLVPIGEGSEEIETTCITDTLTRFGAEVTVASVMNGELVCKMSRGIKVHLKKVHEVNVWF